MFDLEQAIAGWRQQMLSAGIQAPVPLDELEIHLREEVEQHRQSGMSEQMAFEKATAQMGQGHLLKTEFAKARGLFDFWSDNPTTRIQRRLAVLWVGCRSYELLSMFYMFYSIAHSMEKTRSQHIAIVMAVSFFTCVFGISIAGSILLFYGKNLGRWMVRTFALFSITVWVGIMATGGRFSIFSSAILILSIASIWLLRPPQKPKLANN